MIQKTKKLSVPHQKESIPIKIILIGDPQSGKTCITNRIMSNKYPTQYSSTLGVDYFDKHLEIKDNNIHLNVWDFSGKADFLDIRNEFYKEGSVVLIVMDLSTKKCLDTCDSWLKEVRQNGGSCPVMLVGSKSDAKKLQTDMSKYAKDRGCTYFQVSAKEKPESIQQMINEIMNTVM